MFNLLNKCKLISLARSYVCQSWGFELKLLCKQNLINYNPINVKRLEIIYKIWGCCTSLGCNSPGCIPPGGVLI